MEWLAWLSTLSAWALLIVVFGARHWIVSRIQKGVQHKFDEKLESIRADLRKNEELFKSELRAKEVEIAALRDGVLGGRANRQALLDKRRIEAVERVWAAVNTLGAYKFISASMAIVNFDVAAKEAPRNENVRKFFELIGSQVPAGKTVDHPAKNEQPFVSPLAWAYFSAYQAIVIGAYAQAKILEIGLEEPGKFLNKDYVRNLLKAALPHQSKFIDEYDTNTYYYLLDELESNLLSELRKMLEGKDIDQASVAQSAEIMEMVKKVREESTEQVAKAVTPA